MAILIVEDDATVLALFVRALVAAGYRVLEARNGQEALAAFEQHGPEVELLITDMRMPYVQGAELIDEIRQRRPTLKALCISAYPGTQVDSCDCFLLKPFTHLELLSKVRQLLSG